jgi:Fic family protein
LLLLIHGRTQGEHLLREYDEMRGHDVAIVYVRDLVKQHRGLSEGDIRDLNRIVLKEGFWRRAQTPEGNATRKWIDPGTYKTQPNHVITATGELFHFATPEETPARMAEFVRWLRDEIAQPTLDITLLLAQLHHRFVRIHPFDDGNGRVVRLLLNFVALNSGFPPLVIKSRERPRYIAAIQASDAGDFQPMMEFLTGNLRWVLELCNKAAHSLVPLEADIE